MRHFFDHPKAVNPSDHHFLYRCIELARMARRDVYPNPYVGSVVVHDGKIIGEGFHSFSGGPHAEVNAIAAVQNKSLLPESTIYVSLEPCSHHGKTPPCSDLIVRNKIPRVIIGARDPNPRVDGGGIARMKENGVKVTLSEDPIPFIQTNKIFWLNQLEKRSFICLKWTESKDGFVAKTDLTGSPFPVKISSPAQQKAVHALRAYHHGILIGTRTAAIDDPSLTTRYHHGRSPIRIILDRNLVLKKTLRVFNDGMPTWIINQQGEKTEGPIRYIQWDFSQSLKSLFEFLWNSYSLSSVLVEGGPTLLNSFIQERLYDEVFVFQGNGELGNGVKAASKTDGLKWNPRYQAFMGQYLGFLS